MLIVATRGYVAHETEDPMAIVREEMSGGDHLRSPMRTSSALSVRLDRADLRRASDTRAHGGDSDLERGRGMVCIGSHSRVADRFRGRITGPTFAEKALARLPTCGKCPQDQGIVCVEHADHRGNWFVPSGDDSKSGLTDGSMIRSVSGQQDQTSFGSDLF